MDDIFRCELELKHCHFGLQVVVDLRERVGGALEAIEIFPFGLRFGRAFTTSKRRLQLRGDDEVDLVLREVRRWCGAVLLGTRGLKELSSCS